MFCDSLNDPDEKHPNVNICPVCMGHPGTLPVANKEAITHVIRVGLALDGEIPTYSRFDRKNYFYPDLPKGYQISQYKYPFVKGGGLYLPAAKKNIRITRVHLEEDAGKFIHIPATSRRLPVSPKYKRSEPAVSLVDFNRAGVPLMEMVTEPDFHSSSEVKEFAIEFQRLLRYLGASNADMEKGQLRIEVNISLQSKFSTFNDQVSKYKLGTKVEVKNLNSFRAVERAIEYEIKRQAKILEKGEEIKQETRGWDDSTQKTFPQRSKEEAHDYRYFPEPDLPPIKPYELFDIESLRASLPELPYQKRERLMKEYGLEGDALTMALDDFDFLAFFENTLSELYTDVSSDKKEGMRILAINYLLSDVRGIIKEKYLSWKELLLTPENFAEVIHMIARGEISSRAAKDVIREMIEKGGDPSQIVGERGLRQVGDTAAIESIARKVISEHTQALEDYKKGKRNALQFLVGMVMKEMRGSGNPQVIREILTRLLK